MALLGDILIQMGKITQKQLSFCLDIHKLNSNEKLGQTLLYYNLIEEKDIVEAIGKQLGWSVFDGQYKLNVKNSLKLGMEYLIKNIIFPIQTEDEKNIFVIGKTDDPDLTNNIRVKFRDKTIKFYIGMETQIEYHLGIYSRDSIRYAQQTFNQDIVDDKIKEDYFIKNKCIPIQENNQLIMIIEKDENGDIIKYVEKILSKKIDEIRLIREADIDFILEEYMESKKNIQRFERKDFLMRWVDNILNKAILQEVSDIHIQPSVKGIEIRFRIDGVLYFIDSMNSKHLSGITNIILQKAHLSISEFHKYHDGRFEYEYFGKKIDFRLSHIPGLFGSGMVLRLLDKKKSSISLRQLGYTEGQWDLITQSLVKPQGLVLMTGPTGSGKTTSLYAMLNHIKSIDNKIITLEDPVEVEIPLLEQIQINEKRGITFSNSIRHILRHDPDIILVGEIRDNETAKESFQASITGHKVFSTLHTNSAVDTILRLKNFNIDDIQIINALECVVSQRLVRTLCSYCKEEKKVNKKELNNILGKYLIDDEQVVYDSVGCSRCLDGYRGRRVVSEVLRMTLDIQSLINKESISDVKKY